MSNDRRNPKRIAGTMGVALLAVVAVLGGATRGCTPAGHTPLNAQEFVPVEPIIRPPVEPIPIRPIPVEPIPVRPVPVEPPVGVRSVPGLHPPESLPLGPMERPLVPGGSVPGRGLNVPKGVRALPGERALVLRGQAPVHSLRLDPEAVTVETARSLEGIQDAAQWRNLDGGLEQLQRLAIGRAWGDLATRAVSAGAATGVAPEMRGSMEAVGARARQLLSRDELGIALDKHWGGPPEVATLEQNVADLLDVTANGELATHVQRQLAFKAALEGHPEAAQKLLPPGRLRLTDEAVLRDLKAVVLGEGTADLGAAWSGPPGGGAAPGVNPEGPAGSYRPSPGESSKAGLPPLDEPAEPADRQFSREEQGLRLRLDFLHACIHEARRRAEEKETRSDERDRPTGQPVDAGPEVARLLGRELTVAERILVRQMERQGKKTEEMAGILRALDKAVGKS
jgi:hypothetical protein